MYTLIIDTCTEKSLVAFACGVDCLLKFFLPPGNPARNQSSQHLLPTIETGFKQLNIQAADLKAVAVGVGPGSYTGIRVGVATAKGLTFAKSLPLISFCSLEGFVPPEEGRFASLIDARIGGAYVLLQERVMGKILHHSSPVLISNEELDNYLDGYPKVIGPHTDYPDPHHLALIVDQKFENKDFGSDLELLYLQKPLYSSLRSN